MIGNPHLCGGTLLSYDPAYILTAAHCVADATRHSKSYFVSYHDTKRAQQKMASIADWSIHPLYNLSYSPNYDVAIVRLENPLAPSRRVKRVPLWSPHNPISTTRAELVGFGYTDFKEQAHVLKRLDLDISRFQDTSNIETKSDTELHMACHGDSGSPLVVYQIVQHDNQTVETQFVAGSLVRIYGARDTEKPTCPIPLDEGAHSLNSTFNTVTESFINVVTVLDWISQVTNLSVKDLTDPFFVPPSTVTEDDNAMVKDWHIGGVADENGILSNNNVWIDAVMPDYRLLSSDNSLKSLIKPSLYCYVVLLLLYWSVLSVNLL